MKHILAPTEPINAVCFDCDSTLSSLEGIDFLARENNVENDAAKLTEQAMSSSGLSPSLYQDRLDLVKPTLSQLKHLATQYRETQTRDLDITLAILQQLNKTVFIISAGNNPAVMIFGQQLGIPENNIYAVDLYFDEQGQYRDHDRTSPLICNGGKINCIHTIQQQHPRVAHIGDGLNDLDTQGHATRFIGFGGQAHRKNIAGKAEYYIQHQSMLAILPLLLTEAEAQSLPESYQYAYRQAAAFHTTDKPQHSTPQKTSTILN
jgi:phosphoserine phosphatase